jgi:hypothetical protein
MNTAENIRRLAEDSGFQVEVLEVAGSIGSLGGLGPLGLVECFVLKAFSSLRGGRMNSNLICALRKCS